MVFYFLDNDQQIALDDSNLSTPLTFLRLTCLLRLGSSLAVVQGVVDTGCAFSVFPESIWRRLIDDNQWLRISNSRNLPAHWTDATGLTGGKFPIRWGSLPVTVFDLEGNSQSAIPIIGKFALDGGSLPHRVLVGMSRSIFQVGPFHLDVNNHSAWLDVS